MKAFHGKQDTKDFYLARVKKHREMDELVKGIYYEETNGKIRACGVGCTVHSEDHMAYETELGIPQTLARLEDRIFEKLPNHLSQTWPERFLKAIPIGKDLSRVWSKFAIFLLMDPTQCNARHEQCKIIADKYHAELIGVKINWPAAAYAAADAAADADAAAAAYAAYAAADAYAAYAAADAAAAAAAYAAADAAAAAAAYAAAAAREKAWIAQSEKLLELLAES